MGFRLCRKPGGPDEIELGALQHVDKIVSEPFVKPQRYIDQTRSFFREYTAGLNVRDLRRLFDQEAVQAYKVLARDRPDEEPKGQFKQFWHRVKVVFLGVSSKLTPARRLIFAASLLFSFFGLVDIDVVNVGAGGLRVGVTAFWFLLSVAGLAFLLIMELVDRVRVRDELEVARQLQKELLPQVSPTIGGYDFAHSYRTANEVGGDYYDFPRLPDGRLALLIGDASGHGIAAGLLMAIANATLKTALELNPEPTHVAALLNSALFRTGDRRAFMTLFYGLLEPETGRMDFVSAGHPFPMLRRGGGEVIELGKGSLPLGLRKTLELHPATVTVDEGDLLVLFTDGLPEAINAPDGSAFGFQRLRSLLEEPGSARRVHDRILMAFDRHTENEPLYDDTTLLVVGRDVETMPPTLPPVPTG